MLYQVLFPLKNNEKVFINVVCCSRDWRFGLSVLKFENKNCSLFSLYYKGTEFNYYNVKLPLLI